MKKVLCLLLAVVMTLVLFIGCARQPAPAPTPTPVPAPTPTPEPEEEDELDEELGEEDPENEQEAPDAGEEASTPEGVEDGSYMGQSDRDERDNYGIVRLTVEGERITEVTYEEYDGSDKLKSPEGGYTYEEALEAFEALPQELIETQNVDEVDDYTGATGTANKFRTAAKRALGGGQEEEPE